MTTEKKQITLWSDVTDILTKKDAEGADAFFTERLTRDPREFPGMIHVSKKGAACSHEQVEANPRRGEDQS